MTTDSIQRPPRQRTLLHYIAYFLGAGGLIFITQSGEPKQIENALATGALVSAAVVSRDWFKARFSPSLAADPDRALALFSEMLDTGRAQATANSKQMHRVAFLQTDLIEAMRDFNDLLRLDPEEINQRLRAIQTTNITSSLPVALNIPFPEGTDPTSNAADPTGVADTFVPDSTTVKQSQSLGRPGFDA